ncbi:unnamed protein product [Mytilus edulis]|uniref:ShKT domain-containing protein n=1 Tax=Mytilus edulis TaxID=6550 RepID=A0A8S3PPP7_MYTED|nr:unnamed protein product [Mytilus edulis]
MILTMRFCFLSFIKLSICHGFLLTNKTGISSAGTQGLTDGHYLILTDSISIQKQLLAQMETFVLQLQNQLKAVNQEVKDLKSGNSAAQSHVIVELKNETSELREKTNRLQKSYDILQKKFDTIENENNALKHNNAALKSQITDWHNMSIHTKQELDSFTHSIAASNIQNVTTIQSASTTMAAPTTPTDPTTMTTKGVHSCVDDSRITCNHSSCSSNLKRFCPVTCNLCVNKLPPPCVDKITNCNEYDADLCTNPLYRLFTTDNCQKFCGLCKTTASTTMAAPTTPTDPTTTTTKGVHSCVDDSRITCNHSSCSSNLKVFCPVTCNLCVNKTPPPCVNKVSNCNEYDADLCTNPLYRLFREDNCKLFCGLCKTADAGASQSPPARRDVTEKTYFFFDAYLAFI